MDVTKTELSNKLFKPGELTHKELLNVYLDAYFDASYDVENDIGLNIDGTVLYARLHEKRGLLELFVFWPLNPRVNRMDFLDFANTLNRSLPCSRASIPAYEEGETPILWVNTFLSTDAGITSFEIINTTRRFLESTSECIRSRGNKTFFESVVG